ncbi:phosphotransferase system PTS sorbose-specific IIC subunit [Coriobacterium glomerans PW2]|uniref:Phosphotransferase system PTS sorbose-specific IIC subunit n=1 Tax=Coriobacterium glomerans (strain ATCC 49209 / DSM 20642 / JCM 10262 / PW2) TaxID=700015 RepID=F2NB57_CORGP|nr:phosphotransferase system PTS sorbose-specific IIC subunit [Coriobacterium glomerans PW2]
MITLWQSICIGLVAAFTQFDGLILGESKFREPIVTGFLVGIVLGDVSKGLMLGAQMQLMWMGATAIGPTAGLDIGTGGTIGAAVAIATGTGIDSAIMFGVPISIIMQFLNSLLLTAYSGAMLIVDRAIEDLKFTKIEIIHWSCAILTGLVYFGLTFILMFFGGGMIDIIVKSLPSWATAGLNGIAAILPALGFALLMQIILDASLIPYFIVGFVPAAFVGHDLSMIGMATIAVAIAMIVFALRSESRNVVRQAHEPISSNEWED